ncbi:MAG: hypothetical protein JETT_0274 [Candidatus Jettenia ecosi]|uniref:TRASH domain-containing protein n=1 Tax=Candidatus Jettenia ecosi TaxID=2494326 RepID=A0A533QFB8_9BACT|nr:MAG: hypothetical protein JETT_0274 [Candidatus Jettenia ecosi]
MKRIGYFFSVVGISCALITSYAIKTTSAGEGCCGGKEASASERAENKCVVCGKVVEKNKGISVECEGKTVTLCCKDCEATFKKGCKEGNEKCCEKTEHHHH